MRTWIFVNITIFVMFTWRGRNWESFWTHLLYRPSCGLLNMFWHPKYFRCRYFWFFWNWCFMGSQWINKKVFWILESKSIIALNYLISKKWRKEINLFCNSCEESMIKISFNGCTPLHALFFITNTVKKKCFIAYSFLNNWTN